MKKIMVFLLVIMMTMFLFSSMAMAASVSPVNYQGNYPGLKSTYSGYTWFKLDTGEVGVYTVTSDDGTVTVTATITMHQDGYTQVSFSGGPVDIVAVKGGENGYNVYIYPQPTSGDTFLVAPTNDGSEKPADVSHIAFGYKDPPDPTPTPSESPDPSPSPTPTETIPPVQTGDNSPNIPWWTLPIMAILAMTVGIIILKRPRIKNKG